MTRSNLNQINKSEIPKMFLQEVELGTDDVVLGNDSLRDLLRDIKKINPELHKICSYIFSKKDEIFSKKYLTK